MNNTPTDKPTVNQSPGNGDKSPMPFWIKVRNVIIAILKACIQYILLCFIVYLICLPMMIGIDWILKKTGMDNHPWLLPAAMLVILILFLIAVLWIVFKYLKSEWRRDRSGQGLLCGNCGQQIHVKTFQVINSCPHCGMQL